MGECLPDSLVLSHAQSRKLGKFPTRAPGCRLFSGALAKIREEVSKDKMILITFMPWL
jgi:hypothetical protein